VENNGTQHTSSEVNLSKHGGFLNHHGREIGVAGLFFLKIGHLIYGGKLS
jgi:hypothetical protein